MSSMDFEVTGSEVPRSSSVPRVVSQTSSEKRGRRRGSRWLKAGVAVTGLAVVAGLGGKLVYDHEVSDRNKKLAVYEAIEETQLSNATKSPVKLSQNVVILEAGTVYRDTPFSINDTKKLGWTILKGNVAGTVPAGEEQIIAKPLVYTDQLNNTWLGFTFSDGNVNKTPTSAHDVAGEMVWVNASKLGPNDAKIAARKSDQLLDFNVATLLEHTQESRLNEHGQFMSEAENPIAWAPPAEKAGMYAVSHRADMA